MPIIMIVITIVYMQLFVQRHDVEWYVLTHQEVHCVSLSYITEYQPEDFMVFSVLPNKYSP